MKVVGTVWLVTYPGYDEYINAGIFNSREAAETYCIENGIGFERGHYMKGVLKAYNIEEWELEGLE